MMETTPSGKQHNTVDKIAHINQFSGLGVGGVRGDGGGVGGVGGGGGVSVNRFASSETSPAGSH